MYQIQIRIYQVRGQIQAYAEYRRYTGKRDELLATGKYHSYPTEDLDVGDHALIIDAARLACAEIARNLDEPLF